MKKYKKKKNSNVNKYPVRQKARIQHLDTSVNSRSIMYINKNRFAKFLGWDREFSLSQTCTVSLVQFLINDSNKITKSINNPKTWLAIGA